MDLQKLKLILRDYVYPIKSKKVVEGALYKILGQPSYYFLGQKQHTYPKITKRSLEISVEKITGYIHQENLYIHRAFSKILGIKYEKPNYSTILFENIRSNNSITSKATEGGITGGLLGFMLGGVPAALVYAGMGAIYNVIFRASAFDSLAIYLFKKSNLIGEYNLKYYSSIIDKLTNNGQNSTKIEPSEALINIRLDCPNCGSPLKKINGEFGFFIGCSDYPKCIYKRKKM